MKKPLPWTILATFLILAFDADAEDRKNPDLESRLVALKYNVKSDEKRIGEIEGYFREYDRATNKIWLRPFRWASQGLGGASDFRADVLAKLAQAHEKLARIRKEIDTAKWTPASGAHSGNSAILNRLEPLSRELRREVDQASDLRTLFMTGTEVGATRTEGAVCVTAGVIVTAASGGSLAPIMAETGSAFVPALLMSGALTTTAAGGAEIAMAGRPADDKPEQTRAEEFTPTEITIDTELPKAVVAKEAGGSTKKDVDAPLGKTSKDQNSGIVDINVKGSEVEIAKELEQLKSKKSSIDLITRAKGRPASALAEEAQSILSDFAEDKAVDTQKLGDFLLDSEALPVGDEKQSRMYRVDYDQSKKTMKSLGDEAKKIFDDPKLTHEEKIEAVTAKAFPYLKKYVASKALLSDCFSGHGCNCDGETRLFASVLASANASLPSPLKFGLQHFADHIQFVMIDTEKREVWNLLTGEKTDRILGPVTDPIAYYQAFLKNQKVEPKADSEKLQRKLLIAEEDPLTEEEKAREAKISFSGPRTNTNLGFEKKGLRHFSDSAPPPVASLSLPGKLGSKFQGNNPMLGELFGGEGGGYGFVRPNVSPGSHVDQDGFSLHTDRLSLKGHIELVQGSLKRSGFTFEPPISQIYDHKDDSTFEFKLLFREKEHLETFSNIKDPKNRILYLNSLYENYLIDLAHTPAASDYLAFLRDPKVALTWKNERLSLAADVGEAIRNSLTPSHRSSEDDALRTEADPAIRAILTERRDSRSRFEKNPKGLLSLSSQLKNHFQASTFIGMLRKQTVVRKTENDEKVSLNSYNADDAEKHLAPFLKLISTPQMIATKSPVSRRDGKKGEQKPEEFTPDVGAPAPDAFPAAALDGRPLGSKDVDIEKGRASNGLKGDNFKEAHAQVHLPEFVYQTLLKRLYDIDLQKDRIEIYNAVTPEFIEHIPLSDFNYGVLSEVGMWAQKKRIKPGTLTADLSAIQFPQYVDGRRTPLLDLTLAKVIARRLRRIIEISKMKDNSTLRNNEERRVFMSTRHGNKSSIQVPNREGKWDDLSYEDVLKVFEDAIAHPVIATEDNDK